MKRYFNRKITTLILTILVGVLFKVYDAENIYTLRVNPSQELEYIDSVDWLSLQEIFMVDKHGYVGRTNVRLKETNDPIDLAQRMLDVLIIGASGENYIPNDFRAVIPSATTINGITHDNGILTVDFSSEFLDYKAQYEQQLVESLVFSLTSIHDVNQVVLKVGGKQLMKMPQQGMILPTILNRKIGINHEYNMVNTQNINQITVYYVAESSSNKYYVPVTKYVSAKEDDKIKIIIDELISGPTYNSNLSSFIHPLTALENYSITDGEITLNFNKYILADLNSKEIIEEVLYSISLSLIELNDIESVSFIVEDEEIEKISFRPF